MTEAERVALVGDLAELPTDADETYDADRLLRTFLPLSEHARALNERVSVIRGDRGAGKTTLFLFLRAAAERKLDVRTILGDDRIPEGTWVEGFSENGSKHPMVDVLLEFGSEREDFQLRAFWLGYLAGVLDDHGLVRVPEPFREMWMKHRNDPARWVSAARMSLGPISTALDHLEAELTQRSARVFVSYDHLDRLFLSEPGRRQKYTSVLVDLWLSLGNRYRALRPKIFLREDLYQATRGDWPDASKVESRSVRLSWAPESLFRLMVRHMAAASEGLRGWLPSQAGIALGASPALGWMPRPTFVAEADRKALMTALAGPIMGAGTRKGFTERWIVRAPSDTKGAILPRTVLTILREAAREEQAKHRAADSQRLLHHVDLTVALGRASERRVAEMKEEHPEILRLEGLRGALLPIGQSELEEAFRRSGVGDALGDDGARVVERLVELGVMERVSEEVPYRYDVADLYRFAFDIRRKGGARHGDEDDERRRRRVADRRA